MELLLNLTFDTLILQSLVVCLASIGLDFVLGVLISIKESTFNISKLPQTIGKNIFPYVGGLLVLALLGNYINEFNAIFYVSAGLVALKFSKEALIDKIKTLFS